jgi:DNA-binding transcriptional ArsR family regulator
MKELAALGEPTRQRIIELLAGGELSAGEIADHFDISAPAISQHLNALREASLVRVRVEGNRRVYQLDQSGLDQAADWLNHVRRFWAGKLDTIEQNLAASADQPPAIKKSFEPHKD